MFNLKNLIVMKTTRFINYSLGLFMCSFLMIGCPSDCENNDDPDDCYTPYGPCDEQNDNASDKPDDQKTLEVKLTETPSEKPIQ